MKVETAVIIGGGLYLLSKFGSPLAQAGEVVDNSLDYASGFASDLLDGSIVYGGNSDNLYKRKVQEAAHSSASWTTTAHDFARNNLELARDKLFNVFRSNKRQSTLDRYQMSYNNAKYVGNPQVATTLLYDKNENIVGSYDNVLRLSTTPTLAKATQSPLKAVLTPKSSTKRRSSSSSSRKSSSRSGGIAKLKAKPVYIQDAVSRVKPKPIVTYNPLKKVLGIK